MPNSYGRNSVNCQRGIGSSLVDSQRCQSTIDTLQAIRRWVAVRVIRGMFAQDTAWEDW